MSERKKTLRVLEEVSSSLINVRGGEHSSTKFKGSEGPVDQQIINDVDTGERG